MQSISAGDVQATLHSWLDQTGELLVDVYYPHSGGSGDKYFVRSASQLRDLVAAAAPGAVLMVWRDQQYPIRATIGPDLLPRVLDSIPDGAWFEVVDLAPYPERIVSYISGDSHQTLIDGFPELEGRLCGIGREPAEPERWWEPLDRDDLLVARNP